MASNTFLKHLLVGGAVAAGAAAWAIKPRSFTDKQHNYVPSVPDVWYAHRGLHDAGSGLTPQYAIESGEYVARARRMAMKAGYGDPSVTTSIAPENSLAAFAAAAEAGYGIELDLQLSADGQVIVVHDPDLLRVAGDPRRVADLTYDELTRIPLFPNDAPGTAVASELPGADDPATVTTPANPPAGYYQHVPLFLDVLRVVAGRVPLIVEYKFDDNAAFGSREEELMEKGDALLQAYDGAYVIESFNPRAVEWYKNHRPEVCRGQLAGGVTLEEDGWLECVAGLLIFDWMSRPDFVAYDWHGGNYPQVRASRAMGATAVSWTVRSSDELAQCDDWFDRHIFEAFVPER
ncbi:glycerophosphodiester phosphodiesterase family protein [Bifidobacterium simiiventris]|uniref:glycerophosphodiester phosphodiesterase family protein n=1 Tax=Bifidobacterium simiiventris TaxID=2834434 RepID=UPI001C596DDA|nr:glycerophosphodiester phosphodiesterase family protein [Bifidobacterium simiiventris]MBW3079464.1 glycerophosphodiester phosphodiesterase [Bifidobacterium simiiventris]